MHAGSSPTRCRPTGGSRPRPPAPVLTSQRPARPGPPPHHPPGPNHLQCRYRAVRLVRGRIARIAPRAGAEYVAAAPLSTTVTANSSGRVIWWVTTADDSAPKARTAAMAEPTINARRDHRSAMTPANGPIAVSTAITVVPSAPASQYKRKSWRHAATRASALRLVKGPQSPSSVGPPHRITAAGRDHAQPISGGTVTGPAAGAMCLLLRRLRRSRYVASSDSNRFNTMYMAATTIVTGINGRCRTGCAPRYLA